MEQTVVEKARAKNKTKFDYLVHTEWTANAINDVFIKTVTSAMKSFAAKRQEDGEECVVRNRAQASKRPKQRRKRESEWNKRDTIMKMRIREQRCRVNDSLTEGMRRFAISLNLAKKRHEKDRKRVLGEQLDGYLTGEGLEEILQGK